MLKKYTLLFAFVASTIIGLLSIASLAPPNVYAKSFTCASGVVIQVPDSAGANESAAACLSGGTKPFICANGNVVQVPQNAGVNESAAACLSGGGAGPAASATCPDGTVIPPDTHALGNGAGDAIFCIGHSGAASAGPPPAGGGGAASGGGSSATAAGGGSTPAGGGSSSAAAGSSLGQGEGPATKASGDTTASGNGLDLLAKKADCNDINLSKNCKITEIIITLLNALSAIVGITCVVMITYWGLKYSLSRDNAQETATARLRLFQTVLALVGYLFIYAFLQWVVPGGVF